MKASESFIGAYSRPRRGQHQPTKQPPQAQPPQAQPESATKPAAGDAGEQHANPAAINSPPSVSPNAAVGNAAVGDTPHQTTPSQNAPSQNAPSQGPPAPKGLTAESVLLAQSVFDTGQVWIESINDQLLRIDTPAVETPVVEAPVVEAPVVEAPVAETPIAEPPSESEPLSEPVFTETSEPVVTGSATNPPASTAAESVPETVNVWGGAAWEVDAFDFPEQVAELFFGDQFFRSIARHMRESVDAGLGSVLVTSLESGNGRSTVAIGTALAAAATGLRVALVDVDIDAPDLSEQLRLETTVDWISALRNGQSLEQAAIASLEDGVTFLPLVDSFDRKTPITSLELDQLRDQITAGFDLVVFDGSPVKSWTSLHLARGVDSSLIVRDVRSASQQDVNAAAELLRRHGVRGIGVIENFCSGR